MSNHDRLRKNKALAARGGPDYRASDTGKGDVNRTRGAGLTRYSLGLELIKIGDTLGKDSPEYAAALKAWKNAQN